MKKAAVTILGIAATVVALIAPATAFAGRVHPVHGAYTAPHAHAQPPAQARPVTSAAGLRPANSTFNICLFTAISVCIRDFGAGNGVEVWSSDYGVYHIANSSSGGQRQYEDAAGNCLRVFADHSVGLAFGGCDSTNDAEWWTRSVDSSGRITLESKKFSGLFMGTNGNTNGYVVFVQRPAPGFFSGWVNCC